MARNITQQAAEAFINSKEFRSGNTRVSVEGDETKLILHGSAIATRNRHGLFITNCGYKTNVTKERLNGLPGVSIQQKNGDWYLSGEKWDGTLKRINNS